MMVIRYVSMNGLITYLHKYISYAYFRGILCRKTLCGMQMLYEHKYQTV